MEYTCWFDTEASATVLALLLSADCYIRHVFAARALAAGSLDELLPHPRGVLAEQQFLSRRKHVPAVALDFALELTGHPSRETGIHPVRCAQAFEDRGMHAEVDSLQHMKGWRKRCAVRAEQGHEGARHDRPSSVKRLAGALMPDPCRPGEDHGHGAGI